MGMLSCELFNCGVPENENKASPSKQRCTLPETARPGFSGNAMRASVLVGISDQRNLLVAGRCDNRHDLGNPPVIHLICAAHINSFIYTSGRRRLQLVRELSDLYRLIHD